MYNSKRTKYSHGRRGDNFYGTGNDSRFGGGNFSNRGRARPMEKKLDPTLFVKRAEDLETQPASVSSARFQDYLIEDKLKRNIEEHGYESPTAIQEKTIP